MKQNKDGNRSNLCGTSLEKQAIFYIWTRLNEAQIKQTYDIESGTMEDFLVMMILSKSFFKIFLMIICTFFGRIFDSILNCFYNENFRFDLQQDEWGVDVNLL